MGVMQPVLRIQRKLADIIVLERCDPKPFPETRNLCRLRQYLKEVTRMANNETMLQHLQAKKTATKRPGRQSCVDTVCMKEIENSIKKLQVHEKACASLLELQKPAGCSPLRLRANPAVLMLQPTAAVRTLSDTSTQTTGNAVAGGTCMAWARRCAPSVCSTICSPTPVTWISATRACALLFSC